MGGGGGGVLGEKVIDSDGIAADLTALTGGKRTLKGLNSLRDAPSDRDRSAEPRSRRGGLREKPLGSGGGGEGGVINARFGSLERCWRLLDVESDRDRERERERERERVERGEERGRRLRSRAGDSGEGVRASGR